MKIILDTDIGTDMDDTWALIQLLKTPELDCKMILTTSGDTYYRAKIVAKILQIANREDIPIGMGRKEQPSGNFQEPWITNFNIKNYQGKIFKDGQKKAISILEKNPGITIISIGPTTNIASIVKSLGSSISKYKFIGMQGSIRIGYKRNSTIHGEANVKTDPEAFRVIINAPWKDILLAPLDTSIFVNLSGDRYKQIYNSNDKLLIALMENYEIWINLVKFRPTSGLDVRNCSSTLFDTVAILLATREDYVDIETLKLSISDDGKTLIDPKGSKLRIAYRWNNINGFLDYLTERLLDPVVNS